MSGQDTLYQNETWLAPAGTVNVCATAESPLVGLVDPARAALAPPCAPLVTRLVVPLVVQPDRLPVSNPPLATPPSPPPVQVGSPDWAPSRRPYSPSA